MHGIVDNTFVILKMDLIVCLNPSLVVPILLRSNTSSKLYLNLGNEKQHISHVCGFGQVGSQIQSEPDIDKGFTTYLLLLPVHPIQFYIPLHCSKCNEI